MSESSSSSNERPAHIRVVGGTITDIVEGDYTIYATEGKIINNAATAVVQEGQENGVSYGSPQSPPPPNILSKCIVHFRPKNGWQGEDCGIDWMRVSDLSQINGSAVFGDTKYESIVCKQFKDAAFTTLETNSNKYKGFFQKNAALYSNLRNEYSVHIIPWKKTTNANGDEVPEEYFCTWLSLYPKSIKDAAGNEVASGYSNTKATLSLIVDIEEEPDILRFEDNPNFTITPKEINVKGKGKGKHALVDHITIECLNEFNSDQTIIINAVKNPVSPQAQEIILPAGKIKVWANHAAKIKKAKIVLIEIVSDISSSGSQNSPNMIGQKALFEKYLRQALIEVEVETETIDVSGDPNFQVGGVYEKGGQIGAYYSPSSKAPSSFQTVENYLYDKLKSQLKASNPTNENKYDDYFKAFYFGERGGFVDHKGKVNGLNGYSSGRNVVLFPSKNDQTAAHEFLHSFNLPHSFANSEADSDARFTFEAKKTENLLDYSHQIPESRYSLWKWQWDTANNSVP